MANMGFSGLLWMPEVRVASSVKDFIRRIQTVILSPLAQIDAWYIPNPPWEQIDRAKNIAGEKMENAEEVTGLVKELFKLREELIPYLKEAFDTYKNTGLPPFRALVLDYPDDKETYTIEDQYMLGDKLMAAPLTAESDTRRFYIPDGEWKNWKTGEIFGKGFHEKEFSLTDIPLFVKIGKCRDGGGNS
jgi:alpha-D-xyloside xylohydrolase